MYIIAISYFIRIVVTELKGKPTEAMRGGR